MAEEKTVQKTVAIEVKLTMLGEATVTGTVLTQVQIPEGLNDEETTKAKNFAVSSFLKDLYTDKVPAVIVVAEDLAIAVNKQHILCCTVTNSEIK